jgi:hypothetical protein
VIPQPGKCLSDLADKLMRDILPETSSTFAMASTGMIATLLKALAQDAERAVANRMSDVADIRDLFARATQAPGAEARAAFAAAAPASLELADVAAHHSHGMNLLIELHAWSEAHDPALDQAIWDFLLRHTERNRLDV